jgi:hypothetical protein
MGELMFGHNDQQPQDDNQPAPSGALDDQGAAAPQVNDTAGEYIDDAGPVGGPTVTQPDDVTVADDGDDTDLGGDNNAAPTLPSPVQPPEPPAAAEPADDLSASAADGANDIDSGTAAPNADQLLNIKQQALQQLTPLVGHLEQSPEERFRTTMMMIQASDNHALIQTAYEAAQQITDEKVRAQALLDIVNEINYFTQNNAEESQAAA